MNIATWIILAAVVAAALVAVRAILKGKAKCGCSGDCSRCKGCGK